MRPPRQDQVFQHVTLRLHRTWGHNGGQCHQFRSGHRNGVVRGPCLREAADNHVNPPRPIPKTRPAGETPHCPRPATRWNCRGSPVSPGQEGDPQQAPPSARCSKPCRTGWTGAGSSTTGVGAQISKYEWLTLVLGADGGLGRRPELIRREASIAGLESVRSIDGYARPGFPPRHDVLLIPATGRTAGSEVISEGLV